MERPRILTLTNNITFNLNEDEKAENVLSLIELFNEALINDLPLGIIMLTRAFQVSMMNWADAGFSTLTKGRRAAGTYGCAFIHQHRQRVRHCGANPKP